MDVLCATGKIECVRDANCETILQVACSENRENADLCFFNETSEGELRGHGVESAGYDCGYAESREHMSKEKVKRERKRSGDCRR